MLRQKCSYRKYRKRKEKNGTKFQQKQIKAKFPAEDSDIW